MQVRSCALLLRLRIWHRCNCSIGCRCYWGLALLWLWNGPAATAPIWPLAWKRPLAVNMALKRKKKLCLTLVMYLKNFKCINIPQDKGSLMNPSFRKYSEILRKKIQKYLYIYVIILRAVNWKYTVIYIFALFFKWRLLARQPNPIKGSF